MYNEWLVHNARLSHFDVFFVISSRYFTSLYPRDNVTTKNIRINFNRQTIRFRQHSRGIFEADVYTKGIKGRKRKAREATKAFSDNPIFYVPSPFDSCIFSVTLPRRRLFQGFSFPIGMLRQCQDKLSEASAQDKTRRITFATMRARRSFALS